MATRYWVVRVEYPYTGVEDMSGIDRKLEAVMGERSASGAGSGSRDIDWSYPSYSEAVFALSRLVGSDALLESWEYALVYHYEEE